MSIEQFTVQAPYSALLTIALIGIIAAGSALIVIGLSGKLLKVKSIGYTLNNKYVFSICGVVLIALALSGFFIYYAPSTVTVGSGYVNVQFSGFSPNSPGVPFISGSKNFTSSEISDAFVGQIGSGNFTLNKQYGTNDGNTNIGSFTLGNGATAYVASTNPTDLIIQLNNGQYVILGTSNTDALATSFSQNVYPLKSP